VGGSPYVSLFWRLFVPNAVVLSLACLVLILEPADGRVPALTGGLAVMVAVNLILIRRAVRPLQRLTRLMGDVDPLSPGKRLPVPAQQSEVTVLADAFNDMLDRLERERRESGRRALAEREAERRRIAVELHDQIGQLLTAVALQLDRIASGASGDVRAEIADARDGVLTSVDDVRRLARELRPETLDTLGLTSSLTNLVERIGHRTGKRLLRDLDRDLPALGEDADLVVYRVAQEGLTNAVRHAGADCIELTLRGEGDRVVLRVVDDGCGIADGRWGNGIRGMRERALSIGGELHVAPRAQGGTELRLEVPVNGSRR
jgi:two-component system, NarL family, sensor histidine kinase UhpB